MADEDPNGNVHFYIEVRDPDLNWNESSFDAGNIQDTPFQRALARCMSALRNGSLKGKFTRHNNEDKLGVYSKRLKKKYPPDQGPDEEARRDAEEKLAEEMEGLFKGV